MWLPQILLDINNSPQGRKHDLQPQTFAFPNLGMRTPLPHSHCTVWFLARAKFWKGLCTTITGEIWGCTSKGTGDMEVLGDAGLRLQSLPKKPCRFTSYLRPLQFQWPDSPWTGHMHRTWLMPLVQMHALKTPQSPSHGLGFGAKADRCC